MYMLLQLQTRKPKSTKGWSADYDDSVSNVMGYEPIKLSSFTFQFLIYKGVFILYYSSLSPDEVIYRQLNDMALLKMLTAKG
jgi:hypothetical protein